MTISVTVGGGGPVAITGTSLKLQCDIGVDYGGAPADFSSIVLEQVPGSTTQALVRFSFTGKSTGLIYCRFKSNYAGEGRDDLTFSISREVDPLQTVYEIPSASNLLAGTTYTAVLYWTDGAGDFVPVAANGVVTSNALTIVSPAAIATNITPDSFLVPLGTPVGTKVAQLSANVTGGTFSEGSPNSSYFNITADGSVITATEITLVGPWPVVANHNADGGTYTKTITGTVYDAGSGGGEGGGSADLTADYTATSWAQVQTKLGEWDTNWNGTVPSGKTTSDDRVIRLSGAHSGTFLLQNYSFLTGGKQRVRIVGASAPTETGSASKTTGKLTLRNCSGITVMLMEFVATTTGTIVLDSCTDCRYEKIWVKGNANPSTDTIPNRTDAVQTTGICTRIGISDIYIDGFTIGLRYLGTTVDTEIGWNAWDIIEGDSVRIGLAGNHTRSHIHHNCISPRYVNVAGTEIHRDMWQTKGTLTDCVYEYNLCMTRQWYGTSGGANQTFFFGAGSENCRNTIFRQNYIFNNNGGVKYSATGSNTGAVSTYNTQIPLEGCKPGALGIGGAADYNIVVVERSAENNGAGANGLSIVVGQPADPTPLTGVVVTSKVERTSMIEDIFPPVGQRAHWGHANPAGAYLLLKEIFNDGVHWENRGWPVAVAFRRTMNANNTLTNSTYTGTFDVDGNNA